MSARSGMPSPAPAGPQTAFPCCPAASLANARSPCSTSTRPGIATPETPALSAPGGITVIYKDLIADEQRIREVIADAATAPSQGRNCLILTNWTAHLDKLADALHAMGHDPVVLRGGMGAKARAATRPAPATDSGLLDLAGALGVPAAELEQARTGGRSILDLVWQHLEEASGRRFWW